MPYPEGSLPSSESRSVVLASDHASIPVASGPPAQNIQEVWDYDTNGNMIYHGWAACGAATTDSAWGVEAWTYIIVGSNYYTATHKLAGGSVAQVNAWSGRTGLSYS
jgi:hypothetical protein